VLLLAAERDVADEKDWADGWDVVRIPFRFVPHGAPAPTEWMARHPGWFKIPATFVPRDNRPPAPAVPRTAFAPGIRIADPPERRPEARPPSELWTSRRGKDFIFRREAANPEITKHTHWPGAESGVTLGPGYDMRSRAPEQTITGLMGVGVDWGHARVLAAAGKPPDGSSRFGLRYQAAKAFAERHAKDVTLTLAQQRALFEHALPAYEADVRRLVHVPLTQSQFDALVSFDYNKGARHLPRLWPFHDKKLGNSMV
jgi:hypothetical protein